MPKLKNSYATFWAIFKHCGRANFSFPTCSRTEGGRKRSQTLLWVRLTEILISHNFLLQWNWDFLFSFLDRKPSQMKSPDFMPNWTHICVDNQLIVAKLCSHLFWNQLTFAKLCSQLFFSSADFCQIMLIFVLIIS